MDALLFNYCLSNENVQNNVSAVLGPKLESSTVSARISVDSSSEFISRRVEMLLSQSVDMEFEMFFLAIVYKKKNDLWYKAVFE